MGSQCSVFENKSNVEIEIRIFVPPARPDKYKKIIRIKPGAMMLLKITNLCCKDSSTPEHPINLMFYTDGVYSGTTLYLVHVQKYAKILGYVDSDGCVHLKGIRLVCPSFCGLIK